MKKSKGSFGYRLLKPILGPIFKLYYHPKVIGKEEIPKEEKRNEFWYCILIVAGLILLLLGDQIALRFIQKNPNSNNSIFGSSEKIGKYQIDFLEELSLNQVIEKINV